MGLSPFLFLADRRDRCREDMREGRAGSPARVASTTRPEGPSAARRGPPRGPAVLVYAWVQRAEPEPSWRLQRHLLNSSARPQPRLFPPSPASPGGGG